MKLKKNWASACITSQLFTCVSKSINSSERMLSKVCGRNRKYQVFFKHKPQQRRIFTDPKILNAVTDFNNVTSKNRLCCRDCVAHLQLKNDYSEFWGFFWLLRNLLSENFCNCCCHALNFLCNIFLYCPCQQLYWAMCRMSHCDFYACFSIEQIEFLKTGEALLKVVFLFYSILVHLTAFLDHSQGEKMGFLPVITAANIRYTSKIISSNCYDNLMYFNY